MSEDCDVEEEDLNNDALEESLSKVIEKLEDFDKDTIVTRLTKVLDARLRNEYAVGEALKIGLENNAITVESCAELLRKSKDSISDLAKIKQLFEGKPTDSISLTLKESEELALMRNSVGSVN